MRDKTGTNPEPQLTSKGVATKNKIVCAAAELMYEQRVAHTSIEDVQKKAQVGASQMYYYFKDKQELVHAVIELQTETMLDSRRVLLHNLDSFEMLTKWRDMLVVAQDTEQGLKGCPIGSLASELSGIDHDAEIILNQSFERWEEIIQRGLAKMHQQGKLTADADPRKLALGIMVALQGGMLLSKVHKSPEPLAVALDTAIAHIETFRT